ncbi:MAG: hypothetical protein ACJAS1_006228 [Oleiphilaceae bacterium]|jgi:hypothetical protein
MKQITPTTVLVKTWIELLKLASDDEAHIHAKRMLIVAFGSIELAFIYAENNGILTSNLSVVG